MKIAIQGHLTRGKEVIQILKSLGGKSREEFTGRRISQYYFINCNGDIDLNLKINLLNRKLYTLEEFEKEFPFKVGDKVITSYGNVGIIRSLTPDNDEIPYCIETEKGYIYRHQSELKPFKEMKEERNITLTLDKAKEWYKKGGELKEVALQAFTEEELINTEKELTKVDLPKTFEEFCNNCPIKIGEYYIDSCSFINKYESNESRNVEIDKNVCPSEKSAEAHLALIQLEQLRDCWRQGWEPTTHEAIYAIKFADHGLNVYNFISREFLSFPTREMAEEFLKCFRDLIEKAGDLI